MDPPWYQKAMFFLYSPMNAGNANDQKSLPAVQLKQDGLKTIVMEIITVKLRN
jgi:hypothetical protein